MFTAFLTSLGLGSAAGYRGALAALVVAAMHYTPYFEFGPTWLWLASPVVMSILGVLVLVEFLADRSPEIAELTELAGWLPKAVVGFLLVASSMGELDGDLSSLVASGLLGAGVAAGTERIRVGARKKTRELAESGVATPDNLAIGTETLAAGGFAVAALAQPWLVVIMLIVVAFAGIGIWTMARVAGGVAKRVFGFQSGQEVPAASPASDEVDVA